MRTLIYLFVTGTGLVGVAMVQYSDRIKSRGLRVALLALVCAGFIALSALKLSDLTNGFSMPLAELRFTDVLVPIGWFLPSCFVLFFAIPREWRSPK